MVRSDILLVLCALVAACDGTSTPPAALQGDLDAGAVEPGDASDATSDGALVPVGSADAYVEVVPRTIIQDAPSAHTRKRDHTLRFTSNVAFSRFECALDAAPLAPCQRSTDFLDLSEGPHTVRAVATTPEGVRDPVGASVEFEVDLTPPVTRVETTVPEAVAQPSLRVRFEASEDATFYCALDGRGLATCRSPLEVGPLEDGPHGLTILATDRAGNMEATPAAIHWRVDRTAPETRFIAAPPPPPALLRDTSAEVRFDSPDADAAGFECSLNGAPFAACGSPWRLRDLGDGPHNVAVRAFDGLGQLDDSPAIRDFEVRVEPPVTVFLAAPPARTAEPSAVFEFGPDGAGFECSLDGAAPGDCVSPLVIGPLPDGSHRLLVAANDGAGHADPTPERVDFFVDTQGPSLAWLVSPRPLSREPAPEATFQVEDRPGPAPVASTCALDGGAPEPCASPLSLAGLPDGDHVLVVHAEDDLGNAADAPLEARFTLDRTPPRTRLIEEPPSQTSDTTARLVFEAEVGTTVTCSLDGADPLPCTSPLQLQDLGEGPHHLQLHVEDAAGNVEDPPIEVAWAVDTRAPGTYITRGPEALSLDSTVTVEFEAAAAEQAFFECSLDAEPFAPCESPWLLSDLSDGAHRVEVRATDAYGNEDATPASLDFSVDATLPAAPAAPSVHLGDASVFVDFSHVDAPADAVGFQLERLEPAGTPSILFEGPPEPARDRRIIDRGVSNGTPVTYRLRGVDAHGRPGAPSESVTVEPTAEGRSAPLGVAVDGVRSAALLADGRVLLLGRPDAESPVRLFTPGSEALEGWNAPSPLSGDGLAQMADGRLFVLAESEAPDPLGDPLDDPPEPPALDAFAFDPTNGVFEAITRLDGGARDRPTALTLPDGTLLLLGGLPAVPPEGPEAPEAPGDAAEFWRADLYYPEFDVWGPPLVSPLESQTPAPFAAVLDSGAVLVQTPGQSLRGHPAAAAYTRLNSGGRPGAASAMLWDGRTLQVGGQDADAVQVSVLNATRDQEVAAPDLALPRTEPALVLLPGGDVLVVGGTTPPVARLDRFLPALTRTVAAGEGARALGPGTWALLLPAGDVLIGDTTGLERYRPWYLQAGPRPEIVDPPGVLLPGVAAHFEVRGPLPIGALSLVRLGTSVAGQNTDQRPVPMEAVELLPGEWRLTLPADSAGHVPGPALLFALDVRGVPSSGALVLLR